MKYTKIIVSFLIIFIILYLSTAFYFYDINPKNWDQKVRFVIVIFNDGFCVITSVFHLLNSKNDNI